MAATSHLLVASLQRRQSLRRKSGLTASVVETLARRQLLTHFTIVSCKALSTTKLPTPQSAPLPRHGQFKVDSSQSPTPPLFEPTAQSTQQLILTLKFHRKHLLPLLLSPKMVMRSGTPRPR